MPGSSGHPGLSLLQLGFLVQDVLARLGIELQEFELFRRRLLVLVGRVEVAGTGRRLQLDLLASTFGQVSLRAGRPP